MIAKSRRVLGYAGTFVSYTALANKFLEAGTFEQALELKPRRDTAIVEDSTISVD